MSGMCAMTSKVLWDNSSQNVIKLFLGIGKLALNTRTFLERVKIIFDQKGFVATGLNAEIRVALNPVDFVITE